MSVIITIGSFFSILAFIHFFADWLLQTDWEAKNKALYSPVRLLHCFVYTIPFSFFILSACSFSLLIAFSCLGILFISHYFIDSYVPIFWWAKHIRCIDSLNLSKDNLSKNEKKEKEWVSFVNLFKNSPIYSTIFIAVDQIMHLFFVLIVAIILAL